MRSARARLSRGAGPVWLTAVLRSFLEDCVPRHMGHLADASVSRAWELYAAGVVADSGERVALAAQAPHPVR